MTLKWISEGDELPKVGQTVLLAHPRQGGEFWNLRTVELLTAHEGVFTRPVKAGSRWPTTYWWSSSRDGRSTFLVTGNNWWAMLDQIALPPGAEHMTDKCGYRYVAQPEPVWVPGESPRSRSQEGK